MLLLRGIPSHHVLCNEIHGPENLFIRSLPLFLLPRQNAFAVNVGTGHMIYQASCEFGYTMTVLNPGAIHMGLAKGLRQCMG